MTIDLFQNIAWAFTYISIINVILGCIFFSKRSTTAKLISLYFVCSIFAHLIFQIIPFHGKEVNIPLALCNILQFPMLALVYYINLNRRFRTFFLIVTILFLAFSIGNLLMWQKMDINTYSLAIKAFMLLIFCILYWYRLLVDLPVQQLHKLPMFWYNSAFLIYNAGTLFLFLFATYLTEVLHNDLLIYWSFHNILNVLQALVLMVGLWQDLRNTKSRSSLPLAP